MPRGRSERTLDRPRSFRVRTVARGRESFRCTSIPRLQLALRHLSKPAPNVDNSHAWASSARTQPQRCSASARTRFASWERRFGFPEPRRTAGGHRQFDLGQIEALRAAFEETHNVSSAIAIARERGAGPASPARLRSALRPLRRGRGRPHPRGEPRRPLGRAHRRGGPAARRRGARATAASDGPEYGFAWRWATSWLAAAMRVAPAADPRRGRRDLRREQPRATSSRSTPRRSSSRCAARGMRTLTLAVASTRPAWRARCTRSSRARSSSPGTAPTSTRSGGSSSPRAASAATGSGDLRLPRRAARHRREHRRRASATSRWPRVDAPRRGDRRPRAVGRSPRRAGLEPGAARSARADAAARALIRPQRRARIPAQDDARSRRSAGPPRARVAARAEANVRRRLSRDLEREGLSATGFFVLVVLTTAGGELELRTLRRRLQTSKANATEVVDTLARAASSTRTGCGTTAAPSASR